MNTSSNMPRTAGTPKKRWATADAAATEMLRWQQGCECRTERPTIGSQIMGGQCARCDTETVLLDELDRLRNAIDTFIDDVAVVDPDAFKALKRTRNV